MTYWQVRAMETCGRLAIALLSSLCLWGTASVSAQVAAEAIVSHPGVIVLRSDTAELGVNADAIDAALLRDLMTVGGMDRPQVSPMAYEEIQLNAGCSEASRECLAAIAAMAQVNGLVVRSLSKVGATLQLEVVYFDAASHDDPARASAEGDAQQLEANMPSLVRRLFNIPEVAVPTAVTAPTTAPVATQGPPAATQSGINGLTIASIVTLAVGAGVGVAGIVVGSSASSAFDDYKNTDVTDAESAAAADAAFSDAESRATLANILMPIGGALLVGGVVMLVIGLGNDSEDAATTQVAIAPTPHGGVLLLSGAL